MLVVVLIFLYCEVRQRPSRESLESSQLRRRVAAAREARDLDELARHHRLGARSRTDAVLKAIPIARGVRLTPPPDFEDEV